MFAFATKKDESNFNPLRRRQNVVAAMIPVLGASLLLTAPGCGSKSDTLKAHAVQGQVTVAGRPEAGVRVTLVPKDKTNPKIRPAQGLTQADGSFKLSTYVANDGAIEGEYAVILEYPKLVDNEGGRVPGPNVLPAKFAKAETTDISFRVAAGQNTIPAIDVR